MDPNAIVDDYVNSVAASLPRKLRNDVGLELRTLLNEQLKVTAQQAGRSPDRALALEVLRDFGPPEEVAARYAPRGFHLIEPEYAPLFVVVATTAVILQWILTLPLAFAAELGFGEWSSRWGFTAFAWVGLLVAYFALASWVQRRFPYEPEMSARPWTHWIFWLPMSGTWRPVERSALQRRAERNALPLGVVFVIFFTAPRWFLDLLVPGNTDTAWAQYDPGFQQWLLPALIVLLSLRLALCAAALDARWRQKLEAFRVTLWVASTGLLWWVVFGRQVFALPFVDWLFRTWLFFFVLVNTIQILMWARRHMVRVRLPDSIGAA